MSTDILRVDTEFKKFIKDFKRKNDLASDTQATKEMLRAFNTMKGKIKVTREIKF